MLNLTLYIFVDGYLFYLINKSGFVDPEKIIHHFPVIQKILNVFMLKSFLFIENISVFEDGLL